MPGFDYAKGDHAVFVTIRASPGTAPFADDRLAAQVITSLHWLRQHHRVLLYAYCLLPDHLHLLLQLPGTGPPLGVLIGSFKRFTTRQSWDLGYRGALWQKRFHDHIVRQADDGHQVADYILANSTRHGLAKTPENYRWSGAPDPME